MCRSPVPQTPEQDQGYGVGLSLEPSPISSQAKEHESQPSHNPSDRDVDILKRKNSELRELQAQMLSLPRAERKKMKGCVEELDSEIKTLTASFVLASEVEKNATVLNASIAANDPDAIAAALSSLIQMMAGLTAIDDIALFYLISAGEGVVQSMKQHPTHGGVIAGGCHALCNLFAGLKLLNNGDAIAQQLSSADVGDTVIQGMGELPEDRDVQYYGCRVINVLAVNMNQACVSDHGSSLEASIAAACFFASARVAVSKARRKHANDSEVAQWADCAMRLL